MHPTIVASQTYSLNLNNSKKEFFKSATQKLKTKSFVIIWLQIPGNFNLISCKLLYILDFIIQKIFDWVTMTGFIVSKEKKCKLTVKLIKIV